MASDSVFAIYTYESKLSHNGIQIVAQRHKLSCQTSQAWIKSSGPFIIHITEAEASKDTSLDIYTRTAL